MCGRTDLHVFPRGIVNAEVYRDDLLDAYVCPYARAIGDAYRTTVQDHTGLASQMIIFNRKQLCAWSGQLEPQT